jgi:hypothetical protein
LIQGLQRVAWTGTAQQLGEGWRLKKPGKGYARCLITNHPFGWELRLLHGDELIRSQVFRDQFALIDTVAEWKKKMVSAGWQEPPAIEPVSACYCVGGWICEKHPDRGWQHDGCEGAGMPCEDPACVAGTAIRERLAARRLMELDD